MGTQGPPAPHHNLLSPLLAVDCGVPSLPNIDWSSCADTTSGATCTGYCPTGYSGRATATCLDTGSWQYPAASPCTGTARAVASLAVGPSGLCGSTWSATSLSASGETLEVQAATSSVGATPCLTHLRSQGVKET